MDAVLMVVLKKIVDVVGGEATNALKNARNKRPEYELLHGLRSLEEVLESAPRITALAEKHAKARERGRDAYLQSEIQKFVFNFISALDNTQKAFDTAQSHLEIYGSRTMRDNLEGLLGMDAEAMYLFHENYNGERISPKQWTELFTSLSSEIARARQTVSDFIKANYEMK